MIYVFWFIVFVVIFNLWLKYTKSGRRYNEKLEADTAARKQVKLDKKQAKLDRERLSLQPQHDNSPTSSANTNSQFNRDRYSYDGFEDTSDDTTIYPMTHCMTYTNRDGISSTRDIGMVRAYRRSKRWYIDAYCYQRGEVRTFAVENISKLEDFIEGNTYTANNMIREHIKSYE
ncbi:MAG: hypothetical protein L0G41_05795 [Psychrobacter sp.]|nr:hypothetical protein [Psychrobacter sp.]